MSAVTIRYFVADAADPSIAHFVEEALAKHKGRAERQKAIGNELGTNLFKMNGTSLTAFLFEDPSKVPAGLRIKETLHHEGKRYSVAVPDKRTKHGKELSRRLCEVNLQEFNFSDALCRALNVFEMRIGAHRESRTGMAMYQSVCGLIDGKVVFKIPFGGDDGRHDACTDPVIPDCLKAIPESEFIAITKEGGRG